MEIKVQKTAKTTNFILLYNHQAELQVSEQWVKDNQELCSQIQPFFKLPEVKLSEQEVHLFYGPKSERVYLAGLGEPSDDNDFRSLGGRIGKKLASAKFEKISLLFPVSSNKTISMVESFQELLEGILLGRYKYTEFKRSDEKDESQELETINILMDSIEGIEQTIAQAKIMAESTNMARDWGNKPGNHFTPGIFKKTCAEIAKESGLKFTYLDEEKMAREKMGCFLGVSQGSKEPGFINILSYRTSKEKAPTLLFVGKGLTFDSGGISLKPGAKMEEMKHDMCGGAAVLAAMRIIGLTKPNVNVVGIIPASENLPGGGALKPGDVLTAYNGKTVEILNTDAEGRLILADAIAYGVKTYKPQAVVDIATLTGACMIALGSYNSGMLSSHSSLTDQIKNSAKKTGDSVWEMPTGKAYEKQFEGTISDLKNVGGREAGMITAGLFLKQFTDDLPWAHIDIAGTAWGVEEIEYYPASGATGTGSRLLAQLALDWERIS